MSYEKLSPDYSHMEADPGLVAAYRPTPNRWDGTSKPTTPTSPLPTFSTDMANVSLAVPTIHPLIGIETRRAVNHQHEFAAACITPSADAAVRDGALALAWTAIDAATDPALRARLLARRDHRARAAPGDPGREEAEFIEAMERAKSIIAASPGFISLRVERCMEQPSSFLLLVEWETLEAHTEGFRDSEAFEEWRALLHHFYDPFPVVEHFETIATASGGPRSTQPPGW